MACKRLLPGVAVALLIFTLIGCGSTGSEVGSEDGSETQVALGTMEGTTHFNRASAWSKIANESDTGIHVTVTSTTGTQAMLRKVAAGDLDVGVVTSSDIPQAEAGDNPVDTSKLRALWGHDQGLWHVVVWADSTYHSLKDLGGAKIAVGPPGSLIEGVNKVFWPNIVGIDYEPVSVALPDAARQMKNGQVDAFTVGAILPQPTVSDLAATRPIRLLPLPHDVQREFVSKVPGWRKDTIPASAAYPNQKNVEDIPTVGLSSMYVVNAAMDDKVAQDLVKALFNNIDTFHAASAVNKRVTLKNTLDYVTVPLHPGAARYFKEKGIDTSGVPGGT